MPPLLGKFRDLPPRKEITSNVFFKKGTNIRQEVQGVAVELVNVQYVSADDSTIEIFSSDIGFQEGAVRASRACEF